MDELQRIAELLRPLWPGLVHVDSGKGWMFVTGGRVKIRLTLTGDLWESMVFNGLTPVSVRTWRDPGNAAPFLKEQAEDVRKTARELLAALGLEVSDG